MRKEVLYLWHLFFIAMTKLLTKIQYKICEKGEFFDEQERSLEETLQLIKDFPWDSERGADIQLSGPGIVIQGAKGGYLKVALYFNGKFSAYYLDPENHLYEYHSADLKDELREVEEFYQDNLNLEAFEKHFFNIGNRAHFITQTFEYGINNWRTWFVLGVLAVFGSVVIAIIFSMKETAGIVIGILFLFGIMITGLANFVDHTGAYIKISKGHDEFLFGADKDHIVGYNKKDVKEVIIYENSSRRGIPLDQPMNKIVFSDGKILKVPSVILSSIRLTTKFTEDKVRIEYLNRWPFNK